MEKKATRYKFGGAIKTPGIFTNQAGGKRIAYAGDLQPPATAEQVTLLCFHRLCNTSPGNPAYYKPNKRDFGMPLNYCTFKPGRKPILPKGVKRIEDIGGYLPDDADDADA